MKIVNVDKPYSWLQWPVTLKSCDESGLHLTTKFFGKAKVNPESIREMMQHFGPLPSAMHPCLPEASDYRWEAAKFGDALVLELTQYPIGIVYAHARFSLIQDDFTPFGPHITVPRGYWEKVVREKLTPQDEKLCFGALELCLGRIS
jgi:hypothetical protein